MHTDRDVHEPEIPTSFAILQNLSGCVLKFWPPPANAP